jgi:hypothetical protein
MPPVLLPACYDCNCAWNPWPESDKEKEYDSLAARCHSVHNTCMMVLI